MEAVRLAEETTVTDLACLLDAGEGATATLVAGDTRLLVHRAVLSDRSPVFGAMFRHDMREVSSGQVTITDVEGPVLRQLLASLYTLQGPQLPGMALHLLVAADRYGVDSLKATCEEQLTAQLSVETAAAAVFLAVRHCCPSLRQAAVAYIKDHQAEVMATRGWAHAVSMQPEDVDEVLELLSETSSPPPPPRRPAPPPASLPRLVVPQSLACESSMAATQTTKETTAVDLGALLDDGDDALVTLVAGDTRLLVHRAVLTDRSPVFEATFADDTREASSSQVTVADVEGPVLRQLLAVLYTLRPPQLIEIDAVTRLLAAADQYGVAGLEAAWEQQVAAQLSVETAAAAAVLAVRLSWESLRQASIAFLAAHTRQVMGTRGWADAMGSQPDDFMEVNRLLVAEFKSLPVEKRSKRLREAAGEGPVGELEALLEAGADVAAEDVFGMTALHYAAMMGHVEAARLLLARGAEVDSRQWSPLHQAAYGGHAAVVRLLLAASAAHSTRDYSGRTPLHCAAFWGHREAAAALLEAGADRAATDDKGRTALDLARKWNRQQLVELLAGD